MLDIKAKENIQLKILFNIFQCQTQTLSLYIKDKISSDHRRASTTLLALTH